MHLATRISLGFGLSATALFGGVGAWWLHDEGRALRHEVAHELRAVAGALAVVPAGPPLAAALAQLEGYDPPLRVRQGGAAPPQEVVFADAHAELGVPHAAGALRLVRPLDDVHAALARARQQLAGGVLAFAALASLLGALLVRRYVARPLDALVAGLDRVRQGHLDAAVPAGGEAELAAVAHAFNTTVRELADARARAQAEAVARQGLEHGLAEVDKLATVGELAAGLAHEIGSPLQVLAGRAQLLGRKADDPEQVRRMAGILAEQTARITRIVDRLLDLARPRPPVRARVDVAETAQRLVELLEHVARGAGVVVTLDALPDLPTVQADPDQLQQIVLNLLRNALQHARGKVALRLHRGPGRGQLDGLRLTVDDDGPGVPPDARGAVFDPFVTSRPLSGGTGLGLAVARRLAREHGGSLAVEDGPLDGARFTLWLPWTGPA